MFRRCGCHESAASLQVVSVPVGGERVDVISGGFLFDALNHSHTANRFWGTDNGGTHLVLDDFHDEGGVTVDARNGRCYGLRPMPMTPAEWLAAYRAAWLQRDADAAAVLFTEDATYAEQPYQDAFAGPAAVREYWARVTATQSNIEMRYGTPISVGNRTAVEWWTTLVNDGAPITLAGAFILTFDASGRCRSLREYWQFTAGTHEPKPGWGS